MNTIKTFPAYRDCEDYRINKLILIRYSPHLAFIGFGSVLVLCAMDIPTFGAEIEEYFHKLTPMVIQNTQSNRM